MDDQERVETYHRLLHILRNVKLGWVADQIEEQVRVGKTVEKEVDTLKPYHHEPQLFESSSVSLTKGPKAMFPVTVEYSPVERVELVLEAIERTIVSAAEMEQHLAEVISSDIDNWSGIIFHSDSPNGVPVSLDLATIRSRLDNGHHLTKLLQDLRAELVK